MDSLNREELTFLISQIDSQLKRAKKGKLYITIDARKKMSVIRAKLVNLKMHTTEPKVEESCNMCSEPTPETELDINQGICNACLMEIRKENVI